MFLTKMHRSGRLLFLFVIIIMAFHWTTVQAENTPKPPSSPDKQLDMLKRSIEEKRKLSSQLNEQIKEEESKLKDLKKSLLGVSGAIQLAERKLIDIESDIERKGARYEDLEKELENDKRKIAQLVMALVRLGQVPPEAVILRPELPIKAMQSSLLMRSALPSILEEANVLSEKLDEIAYIEKSLKKQKESALRQKSSLDEKHTRLRSLLSQREKIIAQRFSERQMVQDHISNMADKAEDLEDLISKLENEKRIRTLNLSRKAVRNFHQTPVPKTSGVKIPVSGIVRVRYGDTNEIGAPSQGIKFEGRSGSLVVAPISGIVRFADDFGKFGKVVILEHEDDYFSLIAGFGKIDTVVGQKVIAGEPVGLLGGGGTGNQRSKLYYELRHKGKAVNPAIKFEDLS